MLILLVNSLLEGKSRNGGLRIGEMERDALVVHGTNAKIQDMFKNNTDAIDIRYCKICHSVNTLNTCCVIHQLLF